MRTLLIALLIWFSAGLSASVEVLEFDNDILQQRYYRLTNELRCLVCQNQSIAESDADLAGDLRKQVYIQLKQGHSDRKIIDYMVQRYGNFVLYKPAFDYHGVLLWSAPLFFVVCGLLVWIYLARKKPC